MREDEGLPRSLLAEGVKERLLRDILSGRYARDERIIESRVARALGTSQAPVREALHGLEALGVVELVPFRGARVRQPTNAQLLEAYTVRAELEVLAARLGVPLMTDADLVELERLGAAMQDAAGDEDSHAVAVADARFHERLVRLAANATLERVWASLEPFSRTYITLVIPGADPRWTAGLHTPVLDALRSRDPEAVIEALRGHFAAAESRMTKALADGLLTPSVAAPGDPSASGLRR